MNEQAATTNEPEDVHRRHHWVRWLLLAIVAVVVGSFAVTALAYAFRSHPGPKSMNAAVNDFRAAPTTHPEAAPSFARPAAGVYTASGTGQEKISAPPNSQDDSATMPVSVQHVQGGCWRWRLDYNSAHWHEFVFCPKGKDLMLDSQRNFQSWDFGMTKVTNLGTFTCSPPAPIVVANAKPGQTLTAHCVGSNTASPGKSISTGPVRIVGPETVRVGGKSVPAIHQIRISDMSGAQQGHLVENWWFAADTGMPLKATRDYKIISDSVIGKITYTETGGWQLTTMTPKT